MPTYQHRGRTFTMSNDGAIAVRPGHTLSLYSAALHGTGRKVHEYGRLDRRTGRMAPVADVNRIYAGETLYHLPTWRAAKNGRPTAAPGPQVIDLGETVITAEPPTGEPRTLPEKQRYLKEHIENYDELTHEQRKHVDALAKWLGRLNTGVKIAELGSFVSSWTAGVAGIGGAFLLGLRLMIAWANALETSEKGYGFRAVAYATTAWAYGEPTPRSSPALIERIGDFKFEAELQRYHHVWARAANDTARKLEAKWKAEGISKETLQFAFKAVSDFDKQALCLRILKSFEDEFRPGTPARDVWVQNYRVRYPR